MIAPEVGYWSESSPKRPQTLLCVANFPANTGYAWDFIESLYARVADRMLVHRIRTFIAYPQIHSAPLALSGSSAVPVLLDATMETSESIAATADFISKENVKVVYFTDRKGWGLGYLSLRKAGARHIVVHDHTSGEQTPPSGLKYVAKWMLARAPGINADAVIAVSDYVLKRQLTVGLIPKSRLLRVWNGISPRRLAAEKCSELYGQLGLDTLTPLIVCASRSSAVKGVAHLLRAFDLVLKKVSGRAIAPVLLYVGGGPQFAELQEIRNALTGKDRMLLLGYRPDVRRILETADICVVPSLWQDALPLAVLEPMALGKPVIASKVGGVPEMIENYRSGILVEPGDEESLANAIIDVLIDPSKARQLGDAARERVATHFSPEQQISSLVTILEKGFERNNCGR